MVHLPRRGIYRCRLRQRATLLVLRWPLLSTSAAAAIRVLVLVHTLCGFLTLKGQGPTWIGPIKTALMSLKLPDPNRPQRGPNPREVGLAPLHWTHETRPVIEERLATANPKLSRRRSLSKLSSSLT